MRSSLAAKMAQAQDGVCLTERLAEDVFLFNYENLRRASGRNMTYMCYALEGKPEGSVRKYLKNKPKKHVELLLVEDLKALDPKLKYRVTCYLSWSPCKDCSDALVQFVEQNPKVELRILASRIYYGEVNGQGLRSLRAANVSINMMAEQDFEDCWKLFVDPNEPFQPWENLKDNSDYYIGELQTILQQQEEDIADGFQNLTLREDAEPTQ